ncbi:hypothetical protein M0D21_21915 [Aquimarina sp. D1M17]|uniref:hypothetical protein n=1 Tax=Aquimarina acroporae TaxID=2937283 RepID=UPI0020BEB852|nr:hypothetical protein [Aquimarina acroporae]MCK8524251.1 hypothetical protein [Aquimarina acroporae]
MKNLENFGVAEMSTLDMTQIDGGYSWDEFVQDVSDAYDATVEAISDFGNGLVKGASKGYNSVH